MTPKILIIRFSSIGDLVLTTPVIRIAKQQIEGSEVHLVTKNAFSSVVEANPYLDKVHVLENDLFEKLRALPLVYLPLREGIEEVNGCP